MATFYEWIVIDLAKKMKTDPPAEIQKWADNYQRNMGIDSKKLIEAARNLNAQATR